MTHAYEMTFMFECDAVDVHYQLQEHCTVAMLPRRFLFFYPKRDGQPDEAEPHIVLRRSGGDVPTPVTIADVKAHDEEALREMTKLVFKCAGFRMAGKLSELPVLELFEPEDEDEEEEGPYIDEETGEVIDEMEWVAQRGDSRRDADLNDSEYIKEKKEMAAFTHSRIRYFTLPKERLVNLLGMNAKVQPDGSTE